MYIRIVKSGANYDKYKIIILSTTKRKWIISDCWIIGSCNKAMLHFIILRQAANLKMAQKVNDC